MKMTKMIKTIDERNAICYDFTNNCSVNIP